MSTGDRERELLEIRGVFVIFKVLNGLTRHVLELHRLTAVSASLQIFLSTIHDLALPLDVLRRSHVFV